MTVNYLRRGLAIMFLCASTLVLANCGKDDETTNAINNSTDNPSTPQQPQKHNVELIYGKSHSTQWQNIDMDTIRMYNDDPTVDTIFMIPEQTNQYAALTSSQLNIYISKLRERHNINPNKVFGKGDIVFNSGITNNHPEIVRFFADTLRYNVIN